MPFEPRLADPTRRQLLILPVVAGAIYLWDHKDRSEAHFDVKQVLLEQAKQLMAAGAIVLDVRERAAYETRHIAGALLAPLSSLATRIPASLEAARTQPVIVYCGDGSSLGPQGTHILNQAGFTNAVNLQPGLQGWASAGLPIEHGEGRQA